jgi:hypothetical protein
MQSTSDDDILDAYRLALKFYQVRLVSSNEYDHSKHPPVSLWPF